MLCASLENVDTLSIVRFSSFISFFSVVCFTERTVFETKSTSSTLHHMFRMVVLRLCVLNMCFFVESMVVIEVVESVNFIDLSLGGRPYLVNLL